MDTAGNVYFADTGEALVKKITPSGNISIIAGIPGNGDSTSDGLATKSLLASPTAITIDSHNNLYIADGNEVHRISYE